MVKLLKDAIKERKFILKEWVAYKKLLKYINSKEYFSFLEVEPKNENVVWQFWEPSSSVRSGGVSLNIVNACLASIESYCWPDYRRCILDVKRAKKEVFLPSFVYEKLNKGDSGFTLTAYSDILRLALLCNFGGVWMDASIFALSRLPENILEMARLSTSGFSYTRSDDVDRRERWFWRHLDPQYFSWNPQARVKWLSSFIVVGKDRSIFRELLRILLLVWKYEREYPHYFTLHIIYDSLIRSGRFSPFVGGSDLLPHSLLFKLDEKFENKYVVDLTEKCPLQKLTWKRFGNVERGTNLDWILQTKF